MMNLFLFLLLFYDVINGEHFNGGTIRWEPLDPTINSSVVPISIIQTYSWTYPLISCAINVPITTSGRSGDNANLTCVSDCSTDGGYSTNPIDILTDCQTASSSLGIMTSQRSRNVNLTADAHFYVAYVGSAWRNLNDPSQSGLEWSIVSYIDIRMRPDGIINTPPVASVVSPQYAVVNQTTEITIPVSDVNTGDDVRCQWSTYTPGYRRRKRADEENYIYKETSEDKKLVHIRKKRGRPNYCSGCTNACSLNCYCGCSGCTGTTCSGWTCATQGGCLAGTTTVETPGTIKPTSSYPTQQPIDECGGICYPSSLPSGTTLSGCTISFTGLVPNTWYGVSVQVQDYINSTSNTSMSSVPVQFLIYVIPQPTCGLAPIILSPDLCSEVEVGVVTSFDIYAESLCNPNVSVIESIIVTSSIAGMNVSNMTYSTINVSIAYVTFTWVPQINQLGSQQLCVMAYSDEQIQSQQYCVTFNVTSSAVLCTITTTTTTTSTSTSTTTTTSTTSATTTTTTSTTTTTTTTTASEQSVDWPLIVGLSLLALLLALCCACCCCYWFLCGPAARRRRRRKTEEEPHPDTIRTIAPNTFRKNQHLIRILGIERIQKKYLNYTALKTSAGNISLSDLPINESHPNTPIPAFTTVSATTHMNPSISSAKQDNPIRMNTNRKSSETENAFIKPPNHNETTPRTAVTVVRLNKSPKLNETNDKSRRISGEESTNRPSRINVITIPRQTTTRKRASSISSINVNKLEKSSNKIQPRRDLFKNASLTKYRKRSVGSGVTVIKLPRN